MLINHPGEKNDYTASTTTFFGMFTPPHGTVHCVCIDHCPDFGWGLYGAAQRVWRCRDCLRLGRGCCVVACGVARFTKFLRSLYLRKPSFCRSIRAMVGRPGISQPSRAQHETQFSAGPFAKSIKDCTAVMSVDMIFLTA